MQILMTNAGYEKLYKELENLKMVERPNVVKEIDIARSHGDLKENAEYHAARERQSFIEGKIAELSDILAKAQIVNPAEFNHDKVRFGSTVTLLDLDSDEEKTLSVVGAYEGDLEKGYISINSPIAKAMLGKEEGDEIEVNLPKGKASYEILSVSYKELKF
ncbi:transcription elongation factor GreA [Campylobacter canadensis]|nr:transcription elongation factor GreA [Campylobacter canadensis]